MKSFILCLMALVLISCVEQGMTVQKAGCFPASSQVMTPEGLKRMDALTEGDQVLGMRNGKEVFGKVKSWFHHETESYGEYLTVSIRGKSFQVSPKHNMAVEKKTAELGENGIEYAFAEEVEGQSLFPAGKVDKVQKVRSLGVYAPRTETMNYFIYLEGGQESVKVLAHAFAHIRNPQSFEFVVDSIEKAWNMFSPEASKEMIHPSVNWMQETFKFLQA